MKTLYYGGNIITMAEQLYTEAVIIEDGKIIAVGKESELKDLGADKYVDLCGATMLPSFIDAHSHLTEHAEALLQVNLEDVSDFETMKNAILDFISENAIPCGEWVVARNYDNELFPNAKKPTIEELDSICPDHLLLIKHSSCHMGLCNSRVFDHFGITPETPDPKCGCYVKENGKLTGCLEETACTNIRMSIPAPTTEKLCHAHKKMQHIYASYGITTANDGYLGSHMIDVYRKLLDENEMKLDLYSFVHIPHYERIKTAFDAKIETNDKIRIGGIKQYLDGSISARTAWMREPYLNSDGFCGYPQRSDEEVVETMRYAARHNLQIIYHSIGDAANEQFVRCLELAEKEYPNLKVLRPTLIHAFFMDKEMLEKASKLGAVISFLQGDIYYSGDSFIRVLGKERVNTLCAARTAIECGTHITLHTDAPVIKPDILFAVWCAAARKTRNGVHLDGEEISVLDALRAVTIEGAYQYFEEDVKGSIEIGKKADLVILDKDPLNVPIDEIKDIKVLETIKDGETIYKLNS